MTVLVADDEETALKHMETILRKEGFRPRTARDGGAALALLKQGGFDLIITDLVMDGADGIEILTAAKDQDPETEVIIVTGHGSLEGAVEATKKGAFHYLQKPVRPGELRSIVRQAAEKRRLARRVRDLEEGLWDGFPAIVGNSPNMLAVKKLIRQIASSDAPVCVTGESGTGKELVARAVHQTSARKSKRFVAVNCASFTEELLANELFGHEKDAYTGASSTRPGLLESAGGGTVFLDEVGDMPLSMQAKLLRVIQEKELLRVGGSVPVPVDIRFVSATNKDLKTLCAAGIFRQDLYFRLNVIPVRLPSLEERAGDIPVLAAFFLKRASARAGKSLAGFSRESMDLLSGYTYPGNVRELENIIERAVALATGPQVETRDLPGDLAEFNAFSIRRAESRPRTLEEVEREYIQWVLATTGHNKSEAARILGIDRVSLYRKLKKGAFDEEP
jgi:DNA-binding NtrC family response regulator